METNNNDDILNDRLDKAIQAFKELREKNRKERHKKLVNKAVKKYNHTNQNYLTYSKTLTKKQRAKLAKLPLEERRKIGDEYAKRRKEERERKQKEKELNEAESPKKRRRMAKKEKQNKDFDWCPDFWKYHIFVVRNNKRTNIIGRYNDPIEARETFEKVLKENRDGHIKMPIMSDKILGEKAYEILFVKEADNEEELETGSSFRNSFGKVVESKVRDKNYVILEKEPYNIEADFKLFGYNPMRNRKTYQWIVSHIVEPNKEDYLKIYIIKQYVVFEYFDETLDAVICPNEYIANMFFDTVFGDYMEYPMISFLGRLQYSGNVGVEAFRRFQEYTKIKVINLDMEKNLISEQT